VAWIWLLGSSACRDTLIVVGSLVYCHYVYNQQYRSHRHHQSYVLLLLH
jgi:hypothetical protein